MSNIFKKTAKGENSVNKEILMLASTNSFLLVFFFLYLYYRYREQYLAIWAGVWFLFIIILFIERGPFFPLWMVITFFPMGLLLLRATYSTLGRQAAGGWLYLAVLGVVSSGYFVLQGFPHNIVVIPPFLFVEVVIIWTGSLFIRCRDFGGIGARVAGYALLLWGLCVGAQHLTGSVIAVFITATGIILLYVEKMQQGLLKNKKLYCLLAEKSHDYIFLCHIKPKMCFEYISPAVYEITGYTPDEFYQDPELNLKIIHPDYAYLAEEFRRENPQFADKTWTYCVVHKNSKTVWLEQKNIPILDEKGNTVAIEGIAYDITERKTNENTLKYLHYHDTLTGLHNRVYFEERLDYLENSNITSVGIIISDIEGLKLINDTLGHSVGDAILVEAAEVIKSSFPKSDTISRIGGDEFGVIFINESPFAVENAYAALREALVQHNIAKPELPLYMSLGYTYSSDGKTRIYELFKEADNRVYQEKLKHLNIAKIAIVNALIKTITKKEFSTEGHSVGIQKLTEKMAHALRMSEESVQQLCQLAMFHDIGKVGISDHILFKPGPLTGEEILEIKRHCEIGFRIAQSSPDLSPIADFILKHHERWDGKGYPLGIKGEDIPLECRVLAIVDAYDAMISDRPYREALSHEAAVKELRDCAGTQFDPLLVDTFLGCFAKSSENTGS